MIVVGAGPAGATAALAARRTAHAARVLVLDKAEFPRDKACGDGIAQHALDELAALGVCGLVDGYRPVQRIRITTPAGREAIGLAARPNWVVPRAVFDARIVAAAVAAGAVVRTARLRSLEQRPDAVVVNGELRARTVVGADGANSTVRRLLGVSRNPPGHLAIAIRGYADEPPGPAEQRIAMVAEGWPGYVWSFPIGDGRANVGYGLLRRSFDVERPDLAARLARLLPAQPVDPATLRAHHLPVSSGGTVLGDGRVLLAGDAAGEINPLTGEGIFYAVVTGRAAGAAALCARPFSAYRRAVRARLARHQRQTAVLARLIRRRSVIEAAVATAARRPSVFDELVELGLADGRLSPGSLGRVAGRLLATL